MFLKPFYRHDTGCAAYVLGSTAFGEGLAVDPREDHVERYAAFARAKGLRLTYVIDTHVHSDHRSGGRALAELTGARYCLHRSADVAFPFEMLDDGQQLELGNVALQVLHTPGHSPESICLVVKDLRRGPGPWFVLTGDTLFVGAVGRPDLPGRARENAADLYRSIHGKLLSLPGDVEVFPAHFAGSAGGAGTGGRLSSTLALEQRWNAALSLPLEQFVVSVAHAVPPRTAEKMATLLFNRGRAG